MVGPNQGRGPARPPLEVAPYRFALVLFFERGVGVRRSTLGMSMVSGAISLTCHVEAAVAVAGAGDLGGDRKRRQQGECTCGHSHGHGAPDASSRCCQARKPM